MPVQAPSPGSVTSCPDVLGCVCDDDDMPQWSHTRSAAKKSSCVTGGLRPLMNGQAVPLRLVTKRGSFRELRRRRRFRSRITSTTRQVQILVATKLVSSCRIKILPGTNVSRRRRRSISQPSPRQRLHCPREKRGRPYELQSAASCDGRC